MQQLTAMSKKRKKREIAQHVRSIEHRARRGGTLTLNNTDNSVLCVLSAHNGRRHTLSQENGRRKRKA